MKLVIHAIQYHHKIAKEKARSQTSLLESLKMKPIFHDSGLSKTIHLYSGAKYGVLVPVLRHINIADQIIKKMTFLFFRLSIFHTKIIKSIINHQI